MRAREGVRSSATPFTPLGVPFVANNPHSPANQHPTRFGYSYATPEAWDGKGDFRSLGYMRPLCIWSMVDIAEGKGGGE